ncbi:MAG: PD-(D/E)XK nuclease family protein [Chthoniobacterales bacterium]
MSTLSTPNHSPPRRIFLGWDMPALPAVADWLIENHTLPDKQDFSDYVILLPSSRAGRRLTEILAQRLAGRDAALFNPPRTLTPAALAEALFTAPDQIYPPAPDFLTRLAWRTAVQKLDQNEKKILGLTENFNTSAVNSSLAGKLASVCRELRAQLLQPKSVAKHLATQNNQSPRAQALWQVLASAFTLYLRQLEAWQHSDPGEFTIACFEKGTLRSPAPDSLKVIVAALPEFDAMYALALVRLPDPQVLIHAPENPDVFDAWGRLNTKAWSQHRVDLKHGEITVCKDGEDQAQAVGRTLSEWRKNFPNARQVLCAPDTSTFSELRTALAKQQITARPPSLINFRQSRPFVLLSLLAKYNERKPSEAPDFRTVARIARHPDFLAATALSDPASDLDRLYENHQPRYFAPSAYPQTEPGEEEEEKSYNQISKKLFVLEKHLNQLFSFPSALTGLGNYTKYTRKFLGQLYATAKVNRHSVEGRTLIEPLEALLNSLREIEKFASKNSPSLKKTDMSFSAFLKLLIETLGSHTVPPPDTANSIDLIGWLEISGEDAPLLCIASLCEGIVPASVTYDAFLPGHLRKQLSLNHDEARLARENFLLAGAAACRPGCLRLFVPKQNSQGDPLRPSRTLLSGLEGKELATRLLRLLDADSKAEESEETTAEKSYIISTEATPLRETLSVTEFSKYIASPRLYYFEKIRGLKLPQDTQEGLPPPLIGTILHNVFEVFGHDPAIRDSQNVRDIYAWVRAEFDRQWEERFARLESSFLHAQKTSLEQRLYDFSRHQVKARNEGWEIFYTERSQSQEDEILAPLCLLEHGRHAGTQIRVKGRIDRVDYRPNAAEGEIRWRVIDYKTGAKAERPDKKHFAATSNEKSVRWKDLQLPLYYHLFPHLAEKKGWKNYQSGERVELCYFLLPEESGNSEISPPFNHDFIGTAILPGDEEKPLGLEKAVEIAHKIAAGEFEEIGKLPNYINPIFATLCGDSSQKDEDETDGKLRDE